MEHIPKILKFILFWIQFQSKECMKTISMMDEQFPNDNIKNLVASYLLWRKHNSIEFTIGRSFVSNLGMIFAVRRRRRMFFFIFLYVKRKTNIIKFPFLFLSFLSHFVVGFFHVYVLDSLNSIKDARGCHRRRIHAKVATKTRGELRNYCGSIPWWLVELQILRAVFFLCEFLLLKLKIVLNLKWDSWFMMFLCLFVVVNCKLNVLVLWLLWTGVKDSLVWLYTPCLITLSTLIYLLD